MSGGTTKQYRIGHKKESPLQRLVCYSNMLAARPALPFAAPNLGGERGERERERDDNNKTIKQLNN